jgi:hypothetical protein
MSLYRSEDVSLYTLLMPHESAWDIVNTLGELSCVHFVDSDPENPIFSKPYFSSLRRCDEAY